MPQDAVCRMQYAVCSMQYVSSQNIGGVPGYMRRGREKNELMLTEEPYLHKKYGMVREKGRLEDKKSKTKRNERGQTYKKREERNGAS